MGGQGLNLGVQDTTRAQAELISIAAGPQAVRRLISELIDFGDGNDLASRRLKNIALTRGNLDDLMHAGRGLLIDQGGQLSVAGQNDRVDHIVDTDSELDAPAVLLRPDGHVARIGDE